MSGQKWKQTGECTEASSGYFWLAAGAVCNLRLSLGWLVTVVNEHIQRARSHGESLALRIGSVLQWWRQERARLTWGSSKSSSSWLPAPQISSYPAALIHCRNVCPVVMWSDSIRPSVLAVQVRFCCTEAKEVRFLGGRCVGASQPIESK